MTAQCHRATEPGSEQAGETAAGHNLPAPAQHHLDQGAVRAGPPNRVTDAELLHSARECVLEWGVQRCTLAGIARRAGVSRMTLYRRFPDVDSIVTAVLTAEFAVILQRARSEEGTGSARNRLVTALTRCITLLRADPLLNRVLDSDAELLLPYLVDRLGSTQRTAERFLHHYLTDGYTDGSIRRADPTAQARLLLMTTQTMVISARPARTGTDPEALTAELTHMINAMLLPCSSSDQHPGDHIAPSRVSVPESS